MTKLFTVKKVAVICTWAHGNNQSKCGICKNELTEMCMDCIASQADITACSVVVGTCNHIYHLHCMSQWTKKKNTCPLCGNDWEIAKLQGNSG